MGKAKLVFRTSQSEKGEILKKKKKRVTKKKNVQLMGKSKGGNHDKSSPGDY